MTRGSGPPAAAERPVTAAARTTGSSGALVSIRDVPQGERQVDVVVVGTDVPVGLVVPVLAARWPCTRWTTAPTPAAADDR